MHEVLARFSPATQTWFAESFVEPTRIQRLGWPAVLDGRHTLMLAPTGSGKTLAAFLSCIDALTRKPPDASPGYRAVYVSPLKALVYDIERNLRSPLAGVRRTADRLGAPISVPTVDVRTGDTSAVDRRAQLKHPADILVTTPESLYLLLTSSARETMRTVRTVIVDEIHVLAGTKRGVHLALSLERLSELTREEPQRIGLSATQRPHELAARFLGGKRPVTVVDASEAPHIELEVTVPVEDMERPPRPIELVDRGGSLLGSGRTRAPQPADHGIWPSVYPALVDLIRSHRSTIVFTNSRLLCERLAQKLNEHAGEALVLAHHGSISHKKRADIEERLKSGQLPALVATSSLELGIDMGAVDLVILVESPGSVASGLQRVGRAGHSVGEISSGRIFPKFRGDLLECAVVAERMLLGEIEPTRAPRNCLDVLAQQIVAMVAMEDWKVSRLEEVIRRAAPYEELSRDALEATLDMLSGRYPSDELADLIPRITWDRTNDLLKARRGARTLAVMNAGTIPDRGLYRVQIGPDGPRLGELDEEMVYETRQGDTIVLGASAWRVDEIDRDRVLVSPAPGHPGRLPFWKGERPGRPIELGRALGRFLSDLEKRMDSGDAEPWLADKCKLDPRARKNLLAYVAEQKASTGSLPTDRNITVERFRDELGDWRICILTPFGTRVHMPWALALETELSLRSGFEVQVLYGDDGITLRLVDQDGLPDLESLFPDPERVEDLIVEQLGHSALFASRFRENAARALLLPRRRIGSRTPLWLQRRRSEALLAVAKRYPSFPIVLETYRECLKDVFDLPALIEVLSAVANRQIRVDSVETQSASPFARSLVFQYVAAYLYEGDAPLAERKAQALTLDKNLLRDLLGHEELRDLLDAGAVAEVESELTWLDEIRVRHPDALHDLLRRLGDLDLGEIEARAGGEASAWLEQLVSARRVVPARIAGAARFIAVEDAARYRDALGVSLPAGLPGVFLEKAERPLESLLLRYARTHGPFHASDAALRFGLLEAQVESLLEAMSARGLLIHGEIRPGGVRPEWCDPEVLRRLKRRSLDRLRNEVAAVDTEVFSRFLLSWHDVDPTGRRRLEDAIERLQGVPLPFSTLESEILPSRVPGFRGPMLDELGATGLLVWIGRGALGPRDGKIALYRRDQVHLLHHAGERPALSPLAERLLEHLESRGASFFVEIQRATPGKLEELIDALMELVWAGLVTNDTFAPMFGLRAPQKRLGPSRLIGGRWVAVSALLGATRPDPTERLLAEVGSLFDRYGIVSREAAAAAEVSGGYSAIYPVLREMEAAGKVRRGHFVEGLGGAQFALPAVVDRLRAHRSTDGRAVVLAATDPACAHGSLLPWPEVKGDVRPRRVPGARVVLVDGVPVLYFEKKSRSLITFVGPSDERLEKAVAALRARREKLLIRRIDGAEVSTDGELAKTLLAAGFSRDYRGLSLEG